MFIHWKEREGGDGDSFLHPNSFWGCLCMSAHQFVHQRQHGSTRCLPLPHRRPKTPSTPPPPPHLPFPHLFGCPDNPYISALEKRQERQGRELLTIESEETAVCQEGRELSVRHKERHYAAFATETTASVV